MILTVDSFFASVIYFQRCPVSFPADIPHDREAVPGTAVRGGRVAEGRHDADKVHAVEEDTEL